MIVYSGIAIIRPIIPKRTPEVMITTKTSKGCDFTLFEKIYGCIIKLSISE